MKKIIVATVAGLIAAPSSASLPHEHPSRPGDFRPYVAADHSTPDNLICRFFNVKCK